VATRVQERTGSTRVEETSPGGRGRARPGAAAASAEDEGADLTALLTTPTPDPAWVDAAPFRAHVRHLMTAGRLDLDEVAVVLGLPTRTVRHLLHGRAGRPVRRISPWTARRLLLVRAAHVRHLRSTLTPADGARRALDRLAAGGWSTGDVAAARGLDVGDLDGLADATRCSRLVAVRVVALARRLPGTVDDEDVAPVGAAA
jgi:hypothetical protein